MGDRYLVMILRFRVVNCGDSVTKIPSLRFGLRHFIKAFGHGNLLPGIQSRKFDSAVGIWLQTFTSLRILSREDSLHQESMLNVK